MLLHLMMALMMIEKTANQKRAIRRYLKVW
jgi:hypothetical protein